MKSGLQEKEAASRVGHRPASGQQNMMDEDAREKVEAAGTPGPGHRALNALVGEWAVEVKCWMEQGQEPHVSQGTAKAGWKFDGRFLEEEFHGEMMGKPFQGMTLIGYDNTKQTYTSVWISDTQTSMFVSEGRGDTTNRVITLQGKASFAATGRTDVPMKVVMRFLSPQKHVLEMFDESKGGNAKTMEITYTRR